MTSNRPYLLRAFYDWIVDNQCTPHLVINAEHPHVVVPTQFVQNGQIVLNVSPSAVAQFSLDNSELSFNARFGGQPMRVSAPISAVLAIYARENGEGTVFTPELEEEYEEMPLQESTESADEPFGVVDGGEGDNAPEPKPKSNSEDKKRGAHLKVIK